MDGKNNIGYFLEYIVVQGLFQAMGRLPQRLSNVLGRWLGGATGALLRSRTRLSVDNMRQAFPGVPETQLREWTAECWRNLGQAAAEFSRAGRFSREDYFRLVRLEGGEHLRRSHELKKGVILFTPHYTNWELTSQFVTLSGYPLAVVARRLKNPYVNDFINRARARFNINVFLHKNAVRESIRWLKQGNVLGLLIDQRITDGGVAVPFFGRPAATTTMPALLALRLGTPIHPVHAFRDGDRIVVRVGPAMDVSGLEATGKDIVTLTSRMNAVVEQWVRERPPMWLWIHNRWK